MKNIGWLILICIGLTIAGFIGKGCNDAVDTATKEFNPSTLLKKYEYFKNVSAALDKKQADIGIWHEEVQQYKEDYPSGNAPKDERETHQLRRSEMIGIISSYNDLAAEYNAQMAKFNWSFCNAGQLPQGATTPLPREYKPYINSTK